MGTWNRGWASLTLALLLLATVAFGADAQSLTTPPPIVSPIDANGVNLATGTFNVTVPEFSVGGGDGHGLSYARTFIETGWTDSATATVAVSGSTYTVSFGGSSESFNKSGSTYTPAQGQNSQLTFNSSTSQYIYTSADGTVVTFFFATGSTVYPGGWLALSAVHPDGQTVQYSYQVGHFQVCGVSCQDFYATRLWFVTSNLGWEIKLSYVDEVYGVTTTSTWLTVKNATAINAAADNCTPSSCSGSLSTTYPNATFTLLTSGTYPSITITGLQDKDALGRITTYNYNTNGTIASIVRPSGATTSVIYYGSTGQVHTVSNGTGTWTYTYSTAGSTVTTTITDPLSHIRSVVLNLTTDEITSDTSDPTGLNRTTSYTYDTFGRLTQVTYPAGDKAQYAYDARGNIQTTTHVPVTGSGLSSVAGSASFDTTCTHPAKCNEPNSTTDARGAVTNYTYDNTTGLPLTVTPPAPTTGAIQPQTRLSYSALSAYYYSSSGVIAASPSAVQMLTGVSTCQTTAASSCPTTADEVKTSITYGSPGAANNLLPTSVTSGAGDGSLTSTASATYDAVGNLATATGPLGAGQKTAFVYDADREQTGVIGPDPDGAGSLTYLATRITYNSDGLVTETEVGDETSQSDPGWANFSSLYQATTSYDGLDRPVLSQRTGGGTTFNVVQSSYDNANRLTCTAVRMNPAVFSTISTTSPCSLGTTGSNGPDRITFNSYDNADELTQVTTGYATSTPLVYATKTYRPNGQVATIEDGDNNLTTYNYDGLGRLSSVQFPSLTQGAGTSGTTAETYAYDANSNVTTFTKRSGDTITYTYDALNRVTEKAVPSALGTNVFYTYDLLNRLTAAAFGSPTGTPSDIYAYDALGRVTSQTTAGVTMASQYDAAGDRTRLTWPDGFYATYVYDMMRRPIEVDGSGVGTLAQYSWGGDGAMANAAMSNGASSHYGHDNAARISAINLAFINTAANLNWTFAYNPADQIVSRAADNDSYTYHPGAQSRTYVSNGLNQYSSVSGTTFSYDSNGDLTSDGSRSFTYDIDNHMLSGSSPTPLTVGFDPVGQRMWSQAAGATTPVYFVYDGEEIAEEYSAGLVQRRYVPSGIGETPLIWYEGTNESTPRWLHTDNQDSVVAYSDASGIEQQVYSYDPFGNPGSVWGGAGHYGFTGQTTYGAVDAYNYKARTYDPILGRFLEADPIGQAGGVNTYAYTENDPVNESDPDGQLAVTPDAFRCFDCIQNATPAMLPAGGCCGAGGASDAMMVLLGCGPGFESGVVVVQPCTYTQVGGGSPDFSGYYLNGAAGGLGGTGTGGVLGASVAGLTVTGIHQVAHVTNKPVSMFCAMWLRFFCLSPDENPDKAQWDPQEDIRYEQSDPTPRKPNLKPRLPIPPWFYIKVPITIPSILFQDCRYIRSARCKDFGSGA